MKIVNRQKFLSLPKGVLYAKFDPENYEFGEIAIKENTLTQDWWNQDLIEVKANDSAELDNVLSKAVEEGKSFSLDYECVGRDGLYEDDFLFAVFEKEDVIKLIERLEKTVHNYPNL